MLRPSLAADYDLVPARMISHQPYHRPIAAEPVIGALAQLSQRRIPPWLFYRVFSMVFSLMFFEEQ